MKNKGFTLVELLAVIVVLSIIALIGYSSVGNIISSSQDNSNKVTMKNYAKAVDQAIFLYEMNNENSDVPELNSTWLKENVKFEKATVECEYATYDKTSSLYGCKVNNSNKTYCYTGDTATECNNDKPSKIYGESTQNGTPTPTNPVEIQSVGDKTNNLLDISDFNVSFTDSYYINTKTDFILKPSTKYVLSFNYKINSATADVKFGVGYGTNAYSNDIVYSSDYLNQDSGRNTVEFTTPDDIGNDKYLAVRFARTRVSASVNVDISSIQLEEGSTATSYEPYGYRIPITVSNGTETKTTNIYLKEPLRKVGDSADYLDLTNKKVVRNVKEISLSQQTAGVYTYSNLNGVAFANALDSSKNRVVGLSNVDTVINKTPKEGHYMWFGVNSKVIYWVGILDYLGISNVSEFNNWLKSNLTLAYYGLETPIEESVNVSMVPRLTGNVTYTIGTGIQPSKIEYGY